MTLLGLQLEDKRAIDRSDCIGYNFGNRTTIGGAL